jgi:hypothetical protein
MKVFGIRKRFILSPLIALIFQILIAAVVYSPNKIFYVYGIFPAIVTQNPKISVDNQIAISRGPLILIDQRFINDEMVIKHELVHVKQYYRTFSMSCYLALLSKKYLADIEAEAYMTEIKSPEEFEFMAEHIRLNYAPEVSKEYIINCLWKHWRSKS